MTTATFTFVECGGPACGQSTRLYEGAPGPDGWLVVGRWNVAAQVEETIGYYCSPECLHSDLPERLGDAWRRRHELEDRSGA